MLYSSRSTVLNISLLTEWYSTRSTVLFISRLRCSSSGCTALDRLYCTALDRLCGTMGCITRWTVLYRSRSTALNIMHFIDLAVHHSIDCAVQLLIVQQFVLYISVNADSTVLYKSIIS
jgi:hypothetical protein